MLTPCTRKESWVWLHTVNLVVAQCSFQSLFCCRCRCGTQRDRSVSAPSLRATTAVHMGPSWPMTSHAAARLNLCPSGSGRWSRWELLVWWLSSLVSKTVASMIKTQIHMTASHDLQTTTASEDFSPSLRFHSVLGSWSVCPCVGIKVMQEDFYTPIHNAIERVQHINLSYTFHTLNIQ